MHRAVNDGATADHWVATAAEIDKRIDEIASEIIDNYRDQRPLFVCLLRGGVVFGSKLMFAIAAKDPDFQPEMDYVGMSTYGDGREAGTARLYADLNPATIVRDRVAVIVDDVLETGKTHAFVRDHLLRLGAARVHLVVLAQKPCDREQWPEATIYGFLTPDKWLVGMGCDDVSVAVEGNRWQSWLNTVGD